MSAAEKFEQITAEIEAAKAELAELVDEWETALAGDDDRAAAKIEEKTGALERKIRRLEVKQQAAGDQAEEERAAARLAEGERLAEKANARHAEILADYARAQELADELTEIVARNDNFAMADWASTARRAHARDAEVKRTLPDVRALREALQDASKRLASARDYGVQLASEPTRSRAPAKPMTMSELWERQKAAGIA